MKVGLHQFHAETIRWFQKAVLTPGISRLALARELCEREQWTGTRGELRVASARKALPVLAARLDVTLPAPRPSFGSGHIREHHKTDYPDRSLRCSLSALGKVTVEPVADDEQRRQWTSMMATHHPQGWARGPGGLFRYWIRSSRYGYLGGLNFSVASWHQKARDEFIGWSDEARVANLNRVLNNQRLLILPGVRVQGLASRVLELACARVVGDWEAKYNVRPVLAYTYVAPEHTGTSYRVAGWQRCARGTSGRPQSGGSSVVRSVWMKPLVRGWQAVLCAEPVRQIHAAPALYIDERSDWADVEFGRCTHSDRRVRERVVRMGRAWLDRPGASLPQKFPRRADLRAVYRLLSNRRVKVEHILESHWAAMVERCQLDEVVLVLQDITWLNYAKPTATDGLNAHIGLVASDSGRPLGVYALDMDDAERPGPARTSWGEGLVRACELERACVRTRVVAVYDREGGLWALLDQARSQPAGLLVRVRRGSRCEVLVDGAGRHFLWEHMETLPRLAEKTVSVVAGGRGKRREAQLVLRAARVRLAAPRQPPTGTSAAPIEMLAVSAIESDPPAGEKPLHWLLLSTEGEADFAGACTALRHYELRWIMEAYLNTLKTDAGIMHRQLGRADDPRKYLAFDVITACKLYTLDRLGHDHPQTLTAKVMSGDD